MHSTRRTAGQHLPERVFGGGRAHREHDDLPVLAGQLDGLGVGPTAVRADLEIDAKAGKAGTFEAQLLGSGDLLDQDGDPHAISCGDWGRSEPVGPRIPGALELYTISHERTDPFGQHDWQSAAYVEQWVEMKSATAEQRAPDLRRVVAVLPTGQEAPRRVLDIGTGWGPLAYEVLLALPEATLVAHDFSEPMLEKAAATLA